MKKIINGKEYQIDSRANLSWADLSRANLSGADLSRVNLSGADLSGADLSGANLYRADLSGADLSRANLSGANLSGANLSGANLSGANLSRANLSGANLSGANFSGANLSGAGGIVPSMILLSSINEVSDELCISLMRYDASNMSDATKFHRWASTDQCPYGDEKVIRSANFREKSYLIKEDFLSIPVKSAYELMLLLFAEKNIKF